MSDFVDAINDKDSAELRKIYPQYFQILNNEFNTLRIEDLPKMRAEGDYIDGGDNYFNKIEWQVLSELNGRILSTDGIFKPDTDKIISTFGHDIYFPDASDDIQKITIIKRHKLISRYMMKVQEAINSGDTASLYKIFPAGRTCSSSLRPLQVNPKACRYIDTHTCIFDYGEIKIKFDISKKQIEASKYLYDTKSFMDQVESLGWEPKHRKHRYDFEYIEALKQQKAEIEENIRRKEEEERERQNALAEYSVAGAVLLKTSLTDGRNDDDENVLYFEYKLLNLSEYRIKYVYLQLEFFNPVDDPVYYNGKRYETIDCIGPVEPNSTTTWTCEINWGEWWKLIKSYKVKSIRCIFANGITRTAKYPEVLPEDLRLKYIPSYW